MNQLLSGKFTQPVVMLVQLAKTALMDICKTSDKPREASIGTAGLGRETPDFLNRKRAFSCVICIKLFCKVLAVHKSVSC
jgi:hypothetical protein